MQLNKIRRFLFCWLVVEEILYLCASMSRRCWLDLQITRPKYPNFLRGSGSQQNLREEFGQILQMCGFLRLKFSVRQNWLFKVCVCLCLCTSSSSTSCVKSTIRSKCNLKVRRERIIARADCVLETKDSSREPKSVLMVIGAMILLRRKIDIYAESNQQQN